MRKANLIQTSIWQNADFQALPADAKLVYFLLLTQPSVATTGTLPVVTGAWAHVLGLPERRVTAALATLASAGFVWHDQTLQELAIRSWIRHNVVGNSKMETAARDQLAAVSSPMIRSLLIHEYPSVYPAADYPPDTPSHTLSDAPSLILPRASGTEGSGTEGSGTSTSVVAREDAHRVWAAYAEHHPRSTYTPDRRDLITRRLKQGFPADTLIAAIQGNHLDPHCNGDNTAGTQYHALSLILRDADHIERYAALARNGHTTTRRISPAGRSLALAQQLAAEGR